MVKRKDVRAYSKDSTVDAEAKYKREREEKLFHSQALAAIRDNAGLRRAYAKLAEERLQLELVINRLQEQQLELEGQLMAAKAGSGDVNF